MAECIKNNQRGFAIIFNDPNREGSQHDVAALQRTFKEMEVEHKYSENLSNAKEIYEQYANEINIASFVIIVYMTHGTSDGYVEVKEKAALKHLKKNVLGPLISMESLNGKLKWVITQNCRGQKKVKPAETDGKAEYYPKYYVISSATIEGSEAYRLDNGSPFIIQLCNELQNNRHTKTLRQILHDVSQDISTRRYGDGEIQEPIYEDNFPIHDFSFVDNVFHPINTEPVVE